LTLVDTNILLDLLLNDPVWAVPSREAFVSRAALGPIQIIDAIFAETSVPFSSATACERFLADLEIERRPMSSEALWRAGQAFRQYRRRGGAKTNVLPDFFLGAEAECAQVPILTRDPRPYATYFPEAKVLIVR
jgi:predicted nucleic acid-binding protein